MPRLCAYAIRVQQRTRISLIGCGRVGTAIALGLKRVGYSIVNASDINPAAERRARRLLIGPSERKAVGGKPMADVFLIATPDSQIERVWQGLALTLVPGQAVVHLSGALTSRVFRHAARRRILALALHPVMTFTDRKMLDSFAGTYFTLEGSPKAIALGRRFVGALGGRAVVLSARDKPLFHAACVMVSNLLDALVDAGLETCGRAGMKPRKAFRALEPLISQTLDNIRESGTAAALTGPIERSDWTTVQRHVAALRQSSPELVPLYVELSRRALALARRKGSLSRSTFRALQSAICSL